MGCVFSHTGAHDTTSSQIRRSYIAFDPQILEQKRDCSQCIFVPTGATIQYYQLVDSLLTYCIRSTDSRAKERLRTV